jgi:hypothetical protein
VLKQRYLEENKSKNRDEILTGRDWYLLEATRAVNQAIGRVIRHKNDYGAILLCDCRFNSPQQKNQLSKWIQKHLKLTPTQNFGQIIGEMSRFFRNADQTLPKAALKPLRYDEPDANGDVASIFSMPIKIKVENNDGNISANFSNSQATQKMSSFDRYGNGM